MRRATPDSHKSATGVAGGLQFAPFRRTAANCHVLGVNPRRECAAHHPKPDRLHWGLGSPRDRRVEARFAGRAGSAWELEPRTVGAMKKENTPLRFGAPRRGLVTRFPSQGGPPTALRKKPPMKHEFLDGVT